MSRVRIVTDSSAHFLDPNVITQYNIEVVPHTIRIGSETFLEGVNLTPQGFFQLAEHGSPTVEVISPSIDEFAELYARLNRQTDQILSLHMSRHMGLTWHNARTASRTLLGRCDIEPIDSGTTSVGLALVVEEAAKAAEAGADLEEVVRVVRGTLSRVYAVFYVETLDYLKQNGLLSEAQTILGTMLEIKPFLTIEEGELIPMEKVRTRAQAVDRLVEFVTEFAGIDSLVILQNTPYPTEQTRLLQERLAAEFDGKSFPVTMYGPTLATLIGPQGMGLVVFESLETEDDF